MNLGRIKGGLKHPNRAMAYLSMIIRGFYYKSKYCLVRKKKIHIGKNFKVRKKLSIRGPGRVMIGDNVVCDGTSHPVTLWTYSEDAIISIDNNVFLNGTRFGCREKIEIGNNCIIADCRLLDTDFHSICPYRRNDTSAIKFGSIEIGENVWIALDCVVLRGVTIGSNSTISARSVVVDDVPEWTVYAGNPARFVKDVPRGLNSEHPM
jgi:acetyltransferase-like isoleucine patch superfamily enzyme